MAELRIEARGLAVSSAGERGCTASTSVWPRARSTPSWASTAPASPRSCGWFPLSASALWAMLPGTVSAVQLVVVAVVPIGF
jgi:hypothetical protein